MAAASLATYSSAWSAWMFCADFYGFNAACTDTAGAPLSLQACFDILDLFIGFECGLRQMIPLSIRNTYIPGIAKVFDISRFINNFRAAANHNITKCLLDGYDKAWYKKHPAHQRAKIPFTATLALECESFLSSGRLSISGLATGGTSIAANMERARCTCALLFGIFFLLRKGEFLPKPTSSANRNTQMRRAHLRFMTEDQSLIPYHAIGSMRASWLTISIEFSKADQTGRGRIITHYINVDAPLSCIVQRMEAYFYLSRTYFMAQEHDLLFHVPGLPVFTTDILTACMRQTCHLLGLPCDKVSAQSLRYGGATTLAAAGFPEYIIAFYGGWSQGSSAMRRYIKPSNDIVKKVSSHMTRPQSPRAVQAVVNQLLAHRFHASGASES